MEEGDGRFGVVSRKEGQHSMAGTTDCHRTATLSPSLSLSLSLFPQLMQRRNQEVAASSVLHVKQMGF